MSFLIILGAILLIVLGILFVPVSVDLKYKDDFEFKVSFLKITLFKSGKKKNTAKSSGEGKSEKKQAQKSVLADVKEYFRELKEKEGFTGAVKEVMGLVRQLLSHIKNLLKHINICKVRLNIVVGTADAAKTALDYGKVCSAVYPVTSMLDSQADVGFKEINVNADFEGQKCDFGFEGRVKMQVFYILVCAFRIYKALKKFVTEKVQNERK